jgi:hypothetical protein
VSSSSSLSKSLVLGRISCRKNPNDELSTSAHAVQEANIIGDMGDVGVGRVGVKGVKGVSSYESIVLRRIL